MWRGVLCGVLCVPVLVCGLALDSNTIRSSKETTSQNSRQLDRSNGDQVETNANSNRRPAPPCSTPDCYTPVREGCTNRAQRRPSSQDRQVDREADGQSDADSFNKTKAPEMSSCVRSGDCAAGLCCVRYLTGKRCQRIPGEGEACLLRGSTKLRRNLGRCNCEAGLTCTALSRAESGKNKGQGVCLPRPGEAPRNTRHSGKKRRTAEGSC